MAADQEASGFGDLPFPGLSGDNGVSLEVFTDLSLLTRTEAAQQGRGAGAVLSFAGVELQTAPDQAEIQSTDIPSDDIRKAVARVCGTEFFRSLTEDLVSSKVRAALMLGRFKEADATYDASQVEHSDQKIRRSAIILAQVVEHASGELYGKNSYRTGGIKSKVFSAAATLFII